MAYQAFGQAQSSDPSAVAVQNIVMSTYYDKAVCELSVKEMDSRDDWGK